MDNHVDFLPRFFHDSMLKTFDREEQIACPLPSQWLLSDAEREDVVRCCKSAMVLTARETDPATYMDESSLRVYALERGITVCLYGIDAEHQLPLECYIGYTVLKNGMPCSYGGAWVFGQHANFGINIHEAFRGGESSFLLAQLLRVYSQLFELKSIEVEPYQYGLDNPEGISSGAFWFYYRFGFRPVDKKLRTVAEQEFQRMRDNPGYRSSERTLRKFTASNMIRMKARTTITRVSDVSSRVVKMLRSRYRFDVANAEKEGLTQLSALVPGAEAIFTRYPHQAREFALWFLLLSQQDCGVAQKMTDLVRLKAEDQYEYQQKLRLFLVEYAVEDKKTNAALE